MRPTEAQEQEALAEYMRIEHPDILFHSDFGSGTKLSYKQAVRQNKQNGGRRGWPDIFIAHNHAFSCPGKTAVGGLFIELKRTGTRLKKKNGNWATPHIAEQAETLERLRQAGYVAEFAVGLEEARQIIGDYLRS